MDDRLSYHIEEYKSLRAETERFAKEISSTETNFLLAAAAVYAWLATSNPQYHLPWLAWWIPFLLPWFGFIKWISLAMAIRFNSEYVKSIEEKYLGGAPSDPRGWEHFLASPPGVTLWKVIRERRIYALYPVIYWVVFLIVTFFVAIVAPPLFARRVAAGAETKVVFAGKAEKVEVYPGKQASAAGADSKVLSAEKAEKVEVYLVPQPPSSPR